MLPSKPVTELLKEILIQFSPADGEEGAQTSGPLQSSSPDPALACQPRCDEDARAAPTAARPRARRVAEHQRKSEWKHAERVEKVKKAAGERERAQREEEARRQPAQCGSFPRGFPGGMPGMRGGSLNGSNAVTP